MASQKCVCMGFFLILLCLGLCTSQKVHTDMENDQNKQGDMTKGATWSGKEVAAMSKVGQPDGLAINPNGYGFGSGSGTGTGSGGGGVGVGSGTGYGSGSGNGVGTGYGHGEGQGTGSGTGYGRGEGHGYGSGSGGYTEPCMGFNCPAVTRCGNCGSPVYMPPQPCQFLGGGHTEGAKPLSMAHTFTKEGEPMAQDRSNESFDSAHGELVDHEHEDDDPATKYENGEMRH